MTEQTPETVADGFVAIRHKETQAVGTCPVGALDYWQGMGYEVVDEEQVEAALETTKPYDPSEHGAEAVAKHLADIDTSTPGGQAEHDRIVAAERAGKNRTTALPAS